MNDEELLDYYAAHAMQGMLSNPVLCKELLENGRIQHPNRTNEEDISILQIEIAEQATKQAVLMLLGREPTMEKYQKLKEKYESKKFSKEFHEKYV